MSTTVIRAEKLSKRYELGKAASSGLLRDSLAAAFRAPRKLFRRDRKESFWAIRDISLEVGRGEVLGLIGRNGSGKTTLLKILSRITRPTQGWAEIHGRVGSLLEVGTGFHPELTGRENTYLSGAILGMSKQEISRKFDEIVSFAELEQFIDTPVKHYSSGMYVRLAFAVAAHLEPEILLVDEVLAVGDIRFQRKCLGKMSDVARAGRTVILVSHQLNQIRRLCDRTAWVDAGSIRRVGPTGEVVSSYELAMSAPERGARNENSGAKAQFLSWKILAPVSEFPHRLDTLGPVSVAFELDVSTPIRRGHQGIALFDAERRLIWAVAKDELKLQPGRHQLVYTFPFLPLCPTAYTWQVSLWEEQEQVDLWEAVPEMRVEIPNFQHTRDEWNGCLNLPSEFHISC